MVSHEPSGSEFTSDEAQSSTLVFLFITLVVAGKKSTLRLVV